MHYLGISKHKFLRFFIVLSAVVDDSGGGDGTTCDFEDCRSKQEGPTL